MAKKGPAKSSKGFHGSNKDASNNLAHLPTPKSGNSGKYQGQA